MALVCKGTAKVATPSLVVVAMMVCVLPSGQRTVAVAVAPLTPTGFSLVSVWVNFPYTLTTPCAVYDGVVSVAQPPQ